MSTQAGENVSLRPWADGDLQLLRRLMGDKQMTRYLGGPETEEQLARRHARYVGLDPAKGRMFVIIDAQGSPAGSVGYWEREWQGETVWETGWSVLPEFQGQGIATRAIALAVELLEQAGTHRSVHAYPKVDNAASNAVCRKAGFTLRGEADFEFPPGHWMRCNDWARDLSPVRTRRVLHIEDNVWNIGLVERVLSREPNLEVMAASHGEQGIDLARQHRPDVILLDLHLPDLAGQEVLYRLRRDPETRAIPIIVISGDATRGQIERLREQGATDYLTKPIEIPAFLKAIQAALSA